MPKKLTDYLNPQAIELDVDAGSKEEVLARLVEILVRNGRLPAQNTLLESLVEREGLGSTGVGHGVAIPHARSNEIQGFAIALGRTREAVDFDAVDGQPTRLFFLLVGPEKDGNEHLVLLAKIARIMKDARTRERLLHVATADEAMALFAERDAQ